MPIPRYIKALLRSLVLGLVVLTGFRVVLLLLNTPQWSEARTGDVFRAFLDRGLLFDLWVLSWLLTVPMLSLGLAYVLRSERRWPIAVARWTFSIGLLAVLLLCCADIPFYDYLNMRLTPVALTAAATFSQTVKELVSTPAYLVALMAFIVLAWSCMRLVARIMGKADTTSTDPLWRRSVFLLLPLTALFSGLRGTVDLDDTPLTMEDAYFSETPFLNQLGVNAPFSFANSLAEEQPDLVPAESALVSVRNALNLPGPKYTSPIARDVAFDTAAAGRNVVLILVESLSANRMRRFGNTRNLMPFLEKLCDTSVVFDRFYSAGTRTCNGIFSSLYGMPAVFEEHPFSHPTMSAQHFYGLPQVLREHGYRTGFFYPGDLAFDNMRGFLPSNGFDELFGQDDYPDSLYRNSWGVTDHTLFGQSLRRLDAWARDGRPFLATIMTISSHVGYNVPDDIPGFKPTSDRGDEDIYEYADAALAHFFAEARRKSWFANTLFVITGDHGQRFDPVYEVPLSYHHVPLIICDPQDSTTRTDHRFGTQVDIPETVMGLLRLPHVNNTLGIDLTRNGRPCAFFCSDARIAAVNDRFYWIRTGDIEHLYDLRSGDTKDHGADEPIALDSLRTYAQSMTAAMRHLVDKKLIGAPEKP